MGIFKARWKMDTIISQKNKCLELIDTLIELVDLEANPIEEFNNLSKLSIGIGILEKETKKHLNLVIQSL